MSLRALTGRHFAQASSDLTSHFRSLGPSCDHAAQRVPTSRENQNHVGHDKRDEQTHQQEMPNPRLLESAQKRCEPGELHGFVYRPTRDDSEETSDGNGKIRKSLQWIVFRVETGMDAPAPPEQGEGCLQIIFG